MRLALGMDDSFLDRLKKEGIGKSTSHLFVYRYPDSDQMSPFDREEFAKDLEKSGKKVGELAFYLHIPFCSSICSYCHYFKQGIGKKGEIEAFLKGIQREISTYSQLIGKELEASSVLFGGGTPTSLEANSLNELMLFLRGSFRIPKKVEASIESSPETISFEKLVLLRQNFNRMSIGIQDFNDRVLKECNRNHDKEKALHSIKEARRAGFESINIDLIYGLPKQGIEGWKNSLNEVEAIQPESVTASDLRVREGTAFFARNKEEFASDKELIEMHSMFLNKMEGLGYKQLFPYQFVKKGQRMLFLENQWASGEYLGFGPSSCSFFNKWDYNNVFPTDKYLKDVEESGLACAVGKKLSMEDQMIRFVALGLKDCKKGVDKNIFKKKFALSLEEKFGKTIALLESLSLVKQSEKSLKLSRKGILFYDSVSRKFFPKN